MGGFLGIGGSSAKTDRSNQLTSTGNEFDVFNYGMSTGKSQQAAGTATLDGALNTLGAPADYYKSLLTAGRTQAATSSAPAINADLAQTDAQRRSAGAAGTSRTGGTVAQQAEAGESSKSNIDNIINQTLLTGRKEGAQGLQSIAKEQAGIGGIELSNALAQLGLSQDAINAVMTNSTNSRQISDQIAQETGQAIGQMVGMAAGIAGL